MLNCGEVKTFSIIFDIIGKKSVEGGDEGGKDFKSKNKRKRDVNFRRIRWKL